MVTLDRIRLTGLLPKSPAQAGLFHDGPGSTRAVAVRFARGDLPEVRRAEPRGLTVLQRLREPARSRAGEAREERKIVTVLFADLVGFTARAERLDPEDVRAILNQYHARLREEIEAFGGTVEKFIGDAVVASSVRPSHTATTPSEAFAPVSLSGALSPT